MKLDFNILFYCCMIVKKNLQKFPTKIELIHIDNQADNLFSIYIDRSGGNVTENWTIRCLWTRPVLTLLPLLFLPWFTVRSPGFTACCFRPVDFDLLSYKIRRSTNRETETAGKRSVNCFSGPFLWWALWSYSFSNPTLGSRELRVSVLSPDLVKRPHSSSLLTFQADPPMSRATELGAIL